MYPSEKLTPNIFQFTVVCISASFHFCRFFLDSFKLSKVKEVASTLSEQQHTDDDGVNSLPLSSGGEDFPQYSLSGVITNEDDHSLCIGVGTGGGGGEVGGAWGVVDRDEDLNKVSAEHLAAAKARMEEEFRAHEIAPGDAGYVYDKQADFGGGKIESCGWDSDTASEF